MDGLIAFGIGIAHLDLKKDIEDLYKNRAEEIFPRESCCAWCQCSQGSSYWCCICRLIALGRQIVQGVSLHALYPESGVKKIAKEHFKEQRLDDGGDSSNPRVFVVSTKKLLVTSFSSEIIHLSVQMGQIVVKSGKQREPPQRHLPTFPPSQSQSTTKA